jgi:hypothetical protein
MKTSLILLLTLALGPAAFAENAVILKQKAAPLTIISYKAAFEPESRASYNTHSDQIRHSVLYKNTSEKEIVALQIGLASFNAFNVFMDSFSGWSLTTVSVNGQEGGEWAQRPYAAFSFKKYGTGVAYVKAVRFADGTIWRADMSEVLSEMQKFEKDLKKEDLEEKKK